MQLNIGNKIRQLRRRDGRTQEQLAEALGVTSQAVSRWESGGSYPDMEIIPAIANYFGITIDELFGYDGEGMKRAEQLAEKINAMNRMNNGEDVNIDECLLLAREAMAEFPANEKIMLALASVLYNAGYVRYGEHHLVDDEGYGVYDSERHRAYTEWKEAIIVYEKLLKTIDEGSERQRAIRELTQLYLNTGEHERAAALTEDLPDIYGSRDFIRINACDGKEHAAAYSQTLLKTVRAASELMIGAVMAYERNMTASEKVESVKNAIAIFGMICTDGNYGIHNGYIARMYTLLSVYLWADGKHDEAFEALDKSIEHYKMAEESGACFTAPLLRLAENKVPAEYDGYPKLGMSSLSDDWPWWSIRENTPELRKEMHGDPRWKAWVERTKE